VALAVLVTLPGQAQARYASIVIDTDTGRVLHEVNADTRNYPASLTKMMTLYMTFEALEEGRLSLHQRLPVSRRAQGMTPSKLGLRVGQTITVKQAILSLVTKSANDVAVVLAEAMAESEFKFALKMTEKARELGMNRTRFRNASGLPNRRQLSTARDMAKLAMALIFDYPQYYEYFSVRSFKYGKHRYRNHNNLLGRYDGTDGVKTGYTRASGFNLTASVVRNGRRLVAVVFGGKTARSRDRHIMTLLDRGFRKARTLEPLPVLTPPPHKPVQAIREAMARTSGQPAAKATPAEPIVAQAEAATPAAKPLDKLIARISEPAPEAPVPPATRRPREVKLAARELAVAQGEWAVQVGAYRDSDSARQAAKRALEHVPQILGSSRISVTRIRGDRGPIFRARLVDLARSRAQQACRLLESMGQDCLPIQPRGGVEVAANTERRG
jgi:D-alanyl-D-alanine carboxypeptidase